MKKYWLSLVSVILLLLWLPLPALADDGGQGGGGVRFGPYTLSAGDSVSGDLTVFGSATLNEGASFDGDLTVFGSVQIEKGATVDGALVVIGPVDISGTVDGDVISAGEVVLGEAAHITGDLSAAGSVVQDDGAVVDGEILPLNEEDFDWNVPSLPNINVETRRQPFWVKWFWNGMSAIFSTLVMGVVALVLVSIWPKQVSRVSDVVEAAPLTAFGVGFLVLFLAILGFILLAITVCLLPLGIVGLIIVGIGILLGWVALGAILGRRVSTQVAPHKQPDIAISTVAGTGLLTLLLTLAKAFWPLHTLLIFILIPPAAGAVLLTRFGTMPYASNGQSVLSAIGISSKTSAPSAPPASPIEDVPLNSVVDPVTDDNDVLESEDEANNPEA